MCVLVCVYWFVFVVVWFVFPVIVCRAAVCHVFVVLGVCLLFVVDIVFVFVLVVLWGVNSALLPN